MSPISTLTYSLTLYLQRLKSFLMQISVILISGASVVIHLRLIPYIFCLTGVPRFELFRLYLFLFDPFSTQPDL